MAQLAFYCDKTRCMSCNTCTVACKDWNQLNPGLVNWREQFTYETAGGFFALSLACNHCENPACMAACSAKAIVKDPNNGVVTVNREKCVSIKACIKACPYAKPMLADDKQEPKKLSQWKIAHPMQKCTMCSDRLAENDKPACVKACVGRALDLDTVENIMKKYPDAVRLSKTDFPYAYKNSSADNTKPAMFIKKRKTVEIHKSGIYDGKYKKYRSRTKQALKNNHYIDQ